MTYDDWPKDAYLTPYDRDLPYEFQMDTEETMRPTGYMTPKSPSHFEGLDDVLLYFGATTVEQLSSMLFKTTDCGMFAEEPNDHDHADGVDLVIGSIVEGADPVIVRKVRFPVTLQEWEQAMNDIEAWTAAEWHVAHCDERMDCGCPPDALHGERDDIPTRAEIGSSDDDDTLPAGSGWQMRGDY